jgi:predicted TIM-barrel fold metal-dependent hydrolase
MQIVKLGFASLARWDINVNHFVGVDAPVFAKSVVIAILLAGPQKALESAHAEDKIMLNAIALPKELNSLAGRITDVDSHEMIPLQRWVDYFGEDVRELADAYRDGSVTEASDKNSSNVPDFAGDVAEITAAVVNLKGCKAPGAVDLRRRLQVMDAMGVGRQLMFPTSVGLWAVMLLMFDKFNPELLKQINVDRAAKAKRWLSAYNSWMLREATGSDRIRPVAPVIGDTVDELMANTRALIKGGIRAVMIPAGALPGGKSPAHPDLDAFWALLAKSNCVATLHLGTEGKFFESLKGWRDAPAFEGYRTVAEFSTDPWYLSMLHIPCQNFLATMITGGVFERHPALRFGVIEVGAYWVGPMMEGLDLWHRNMAAFAKHKEGAQRLPSSYMKTNVRVSVFSFEAIDTYLERYDLADVLCFSSDYPHVEGGKDMINVMYKKVERFGPEVIEKFFVTNGQFLLPD